MRTALILQVVSLLALAVATGINIFRIAELEKQLQRLKQRSQISQR